MPDQDNPAPFLCDDRGNSYAIDIPRWHGAPGEPVTLMPLPGIGPSDIDHAERGLWRYRKAFALDYPAPVSLGEGCTPLLHRTFGGIPVHMKLEWFNPSGSFKDRGSSLVASTMSLQGIDHALTDSSGNGGSSLAAYCAAAGINLKIVVPDTTSPSKVTQARAYGAQIEFVSGGRQAAQDAATSQAGERFYAGHNWHPFFLDGVKSIGYEIWEDLGFRAPDNIVVVTGGGSIALGCDAAFDELLRGGHISAMPRLMLAQPASCAPIFAAFHGREAEADRATGGASLAEGAALPHPVRLNRVLDTVRRSGGTVVAVGEADIARATLDLASMGLFCEPTSAVSAAAVTQLSVAGAIRADETTVVILTGSGLKTASTIATLLPDQG